MTSGRAAALAALLLVALCAVTLPGLGRLRFDDDINRVFLSDSALSQAQRRLEAGAIRPAGR